MKNNEGKKAVLEEAVQKARKAGNIEDTLKYMDQIEDLENESNTEDQKAKADLKKQSEWEEAMQHALIAIAENDYKFIRDSNTFIIKNPDKNGQKEFIDVKLDSMKNSDPELCNGLTLKLFREELKKQDRIYITRTASLRKNIPDTVLNLMSLDDWIQPDPENFDYHPAFDALFASMGNRKEDNIEHLERVITYKYCHPETYMLPCIIIYGEGSVGKNVLVDVLLNTLFGGQTTSFEGSKMFGNFQSNIVGKTVVLMNELKRTKANMEILKNNIMVPRLVINEKGVKEYTADNTPLYFIGSNDPHGPITLSDDGSDRRWSILRIPYQDKRNILMETINEYCEESVTNLDELNNLIKSVFANEEEVAKWIHAMILKYGEQEIPEAHLREDATEMLEAQISAEILFYESVFSQFDFTGIKFTDLWVLYVQYMKAVNAIGINSQVYMRGNLIAWIEKNKDLEWCGGYGKPGGNLNIQQAGKNVTACQGVIPRGGVKSLDQVVLAKFNDRIRKHINENTLLESTVMSNYRRGNP